MHQLVYTLAIIGGLWYIGDKLIKPPIDRLSKYFKYLKVKSYYKARAYRDGGVGGGSVRIATFEKWLKDGDCAFTR
jgi:hypothetical protein